MTYVVPASLTFFGFLLVGGIRRVRRECIEEQSKKYQLTYKGPLKAESPNDLAQWIHCKPFPKDPTSPFKADLYIEGMEGKPSCACSFLRNDILQRIKRLEENHAAPIDLELARRPFKEPSLFTAHRRDG